MQYTPGWDWIQPVRDRNTGIWDEVSLTTTGDVRVQHPYVVTKVPGVRQPNDSKQAPAYLETSVELKNVTKQAVEGTVTAEYDGKKIARKVSLKPLETQIVSFENRH